MRKANFKILAFSSLAAAIMFLLVAYVQIPIPAGGGFINIGDSVIFIFACLLPMPYTSAAAAIGISLADMSTGWAVFAPFTFVIKFIMALFFDAKKPMSSVRNISGAVGAALFMSAGYYVADAVINNDWVIIPRSLLGYRLIQAAINVAIFSVVSVDMNISGAFDRIKKDLNK